eukprot:CAMPEP_0180136594 /NCGR_PEP_ID=MMETSP0986-20121125/11611_1 /TAXON_ID=697907 /ORGANISM="non described non described, Strain CCMP2293" /LENGTH=216 /DNA_ID=CAMNT_0022077697 /DNA_START=51 /DNA_END=701 /DNA_ORIENTATION=+
MAKSRGSLKNNKTHVITRKQKKKPIGMAKANSILPKTAQLWKPKGTVRENYANLGLAAKINSDSAIAVDVNARAGKLSGNKTSKLVLGTGQLQVASAGINIEESQDVGATREGEIALEEMEDRVAHAQPARLFMFEGDQEFVERLMKKHGKDNFKKMAMDMRLNPYQHTPKQISKKFDKYFRMTQESSSTALSRSGATKLPCSTWNVGPGKFKEFK